MWIAKEGDERKKEFIETAIRIFSNKGYEKSSINDILKEMNITKGAFYYYFKSKEDLLNEVVSQLVKAIEIIIKDVAERDDLSAINKLELIFNNMNNYREANAQAYRELYELQRRAENAFIARKLTEKTLSSNIVHIEKIMIQGIREGSFKVSNTSETAELYIRLATICKEKVMGIIEQESCNDKQVMYDKVQNTLNFYCETLERVLCAKEGAFSFMTR